MPSKRRVVVTFESIPDRGHNAGWLCWFGAKHTDDDPIGRGGTIREAFEFMLAGIADAAIEKTAWSYGDQVK